MVIDDRKFAAIIKHFGTPFKDGDGLAYRLEIPLKDWASIPHNQRVIPADGSSWNPDKGPAVAFVTFIDDSKQSEATQ